MMNFASLGRFWGSPSLHRYRRTAAAIALLGFSTSAPALAIGIADSASKAQPTATDSVGQILRGLQADALGAPHVVTWEGRDLDGDGASDVVNPTGLGPRGVDAYGSGRFGASRDGGARQHAGVDYIAKAGQMVLAPISGYVTKIGYPYGDDTELRYVQIDNPALKISARVFYVDPGVVVGQAVRLGTRIGVAQTLQARYPAGITDHVHLEMADGAGHKLDAATLLLARVG
jgi:murein DD-endopeptidase MepM/ murein hydrolase activator NlpD